MAKLKVVVSCSGLKKEIVERFNREYAIALKKGVNNGKVG